MRPHRITLPGATGQVDNAGGHVVGYAFRETTGAAAAHFRLWDGSANSGGLLLPISLSADQSTRDFLSAPWIAYETGLFYELIGGTVEGVVYVVSKDQGHEWGLPVVVIGSLEIDVAGGVGEFNL